MLFAVASLIAIAFAGCVDSEPTTDGNDVTVKTPGGDQAGATAGSERPRGETVSTNETEVSQGQPEYEFPEDYPVFCDENNTDSCDFYDEIFHGYTLYDVDTPKVDVIIVPPASPEAQRDIVTLRMAAQQWSDGIEELGEPWFTEAFEMNVYVLGEDDIPDEARDDPEIVVLAAEFNPTLLFGIGLEPFHFFNQESPCRSIDEEVLRYADHAHHGMSIKAAECEQGGFTCFAINTNFAWPTGDAHTMHDLVAHEIGHCLGPGHVGDALDFSANRAPIEDIMSYTPIEDQVHCVSTLNVRVMEGIYGDLIPTRPDDAVPLLYAGDFVHMSPWDYMNVECENPPVGILS